jgi:hypothetical protein
LVVFPVVWESNNTLLKSVAWIPVGWEMVAGTVGQVAAVDILTETRILVDTDGITLLAWGVRFVEVFGVDTSGDVKSVT